MKLQTKRGLEKLSDHLKDKDGEVSLELYTKEKYEFDRSLKFSPKYLVNNRLLRQLTANSGWSGILFVGEMGRFGNDQN
jgi:hypothetical protein